MSMDIDTKEGNSSAKTKHIKFDNLYDLLFTSTGQQKESLNKKLLITGDKLDFLEQQGRNIVIVNQEGGDKKTVDMDKLKISKTFKLVNPVPKF